MIRFGLEVKRYPFWGVCHVYSSSHHINRYTLQWCLIYAGFHVHTIFKLYNSPKGATPPQSPCPVAFANLRMSLIEFELHSAEKKRFVAPCTSETAAIFCWSTVPIHFHGCGVLWAFRLFWFVFCKPLFNHSLHPPAQSPTFCIQFRTQPKPIIMPIDKLVENWFWTRSKNKITFPGEIPGKLGQAPLCPNLGASLVAHLVCTRSVCHSVRWGRLAAKVPEMFVDCSLSTERAAVPELVGNPTRKKRRKTITRTPGTESWWSEEGVKWEIDYQHSFIFSLDTSSSIRSIRGLSGYAEPASWQTIAGKTVRRKRIRVNCSAP